MIIVLTLGLLPFSGGAAPVHAADWSQGVVIRADRIEIKGLLPLLAIGNDGGPVLRLIAGEAKVYGMKMAAAHQGRGWGMEIADGGMVPIRGLLVDATALGFRIEGLPIQIGDSIPSIVLHDVFMKVDQLDAKQIDLHGLDMSTKPEVSLKPDGPVLDLRPFAKLQSLSKEKLEEEINERLSDMATESPKDEDQDGKEEKEEEESDGKGEDSTGTDAPDNVTDPDSEPDPKPEPDPDPEDPNQPEPPPEEGGETPDEPEAIIEETVKLTKTIGLVRARQLVEVAKKYDASVTLQKGDKEAKADDYWAVVGLGLVRGMEIVLTAGGKEAEQAANALVRFLTDR